MLKESTKWPIKYTFLYPGDHEQSLYIYANIVCDIPEKDDVIKIRGLIVTEDGWQVTEPDSFEKSCALYKFTLTNLCIFIIVYPMQFLFMAPDSQIIILVYD
jgi:hypothetical protein